MSHAQDVLTTGQVAKICNVAPRTVTKWFDNGQLRGYRIPGSKDRRIPLDKLIQFLKAHGMPLNGLEGNKIRLLIVDHDEELADTLKRVLSEKNRYEVELAPCLFSAGVQAEKSRPHVILIDVSMPDMNIRQLCRHLRANHELQGTKLIAASAAMTDALGQECLQLGFESYIKKPFDAVTIVQAIEDAVAIVT